MFIDTEIGQMDESFGDIFGLGRILVSSKSSQPFLEHVNSEGVIARH